MLTVHSSTAALACESLVFRGQKAHEDALARELGAVVLL
jgi:hypothetical protein